MNSTQKVQYPSIEEVVDEKLNLNHVDHDTIVSDSKIFINFPISTRKGSQLVIDKIYKRLKEEGRKTLSFEESIELEEDNKVTFITIGTN